MKKYWTEAPFQHIFQFSIYIRHFLNLPHPLDVSYSILIKPSYSITLPSLEKCTEQIPPSAESRPIRFSKANNAPSSRRVHGPSLRNRRRGIRPAPLAPPPEWTSSLFVITWRGCAWGRCTRPAPCGRRPTPAGTTAPSWGWKLGRRRRLRRCWRSRTSPGRTRPSPGWTAGRTWKQGVDFVDVLRGQGC